MSVCCHWLQRHILRSGSLWCATKILRCRCHKDAGISNRQYYCGVRRSDISANNRHTDGTNCAPLLADLFLYSYEAEFIQSLLQAGKKHLAQQFNFIYRYKDDVLPLKNTKFAEYLEFIYPSELGIKETTETAASSSYLDCYLYIDNGKLTTRLYDKRDDFNIPIVNFPFLSSNIPSAPAYGVCVSQLIRYARTCSNYQDFMERGKVLTTKLLSQGYQKNQTGSNT